jgi:cation diffusion facilitator family transporter
VLVTFFTIHYSAKPADEEHPFGHGKIESIAAGIQAMLLLGASISIGYSAIRRIIYGEPVQLTEAGIGVMLISLIVSILLSRHLFKVSRATGSVALEANANNIRSDVYSTSGVMVGLTLVRLTGLNIIDPIIALVVVLLILRATYQVTRMAFGGLVDVRLPKAEEDEIKSCLKEHYSEVVSFHRLRTRKAGRQRYIDLHLVMPKHASVDKAHQMCDHLEQDIENRLHHTSLTIHVEPCRIECDQCRVVCSLRRRSP